MINIPTMKNISRFLIGIMIPTILYSPSIGAVSDSEAIRLQNAGVDAFTAMDFDLARRLWGEAAARAQQTKDWGTLVLLTQDYLELISKDPGHKNDNTQAALDTWVWATSTCYDEATFSATRPGSGENCPDGIAGCRAVVQVFNSFFDTLDPGAQFDAFQAQVNIARGVTTCRPAPNNPNPPTGTDPVFDRQFGAAQYFMHSIKHSSTGGDVTEDVNFCFPRKPDEKGYVVLPDGSGGTFWRQIDNVSGPFSTPRAVCAAAKARGVGNATYSSWNANWYFDCSQLP